MSAFINQHYSQAIDFLKKWRKRYPKNILCEKIVLNTFYRQASMENAFASMNEGFEEKQRHQSINEAFTDVHIRYSKESEKLAAINFQNLLESNPSKNYAGIQYSGFKQFISASNSYDKETAEDAYEQIAIGYIANYITNHLVMLWLASGFLGDKRTAALEKTTGLGIENIDSYKMPFAHIYDIITQNVTLPFIQNMDYSTLKKDLGI
ncbi:hypothetical protein KLP40_09995 [Hymenobacter sp. NST-14]|uniref:hypothetical protein n=1 Tax=Hymenobacter piscis TaxID=2839984 RepID=UPI001C0379EC|nr:hypothetical protein [Hymenobacter piscis]MBT9393492.1 hypothetical protein [Hymenobacter piscis]